MTQLIHVPHLIKTVIWFDEINMTGLIQTQKTANDDLIADGENAGVLGTLAGLFMDNPSSHYCSLSTQRRTHCTDTFVPSFFYPLLLFSAHHCSAGLSNSILCENLYNTLVGLFYYFIWVLKSPTARLSNRQLYHQGPRPQSTGPLAPPLEVRSPLDPCPWFNANMTKNHWLRHNHWRALCPGLASPQCPGNPQVMVHTSFLSILGRRWRAFCPVLQWTLVLKRLERDTELDMNTDAATSIASVKLTMFCCGAEL